MAGVEGGRVGGTGGEVSQAKEAASRRLSPPHYVDYAFTLSPLENISKLLSRGLTGSVIRV